MLGRLEGLGHCLAALVRQLVLGHDEVVDLCLAHRLAQVHDANICKGVAAQVQRLHALRLLFDYQANLVYVHVAQVLLRKVHLASRRLRLVDVV